MRSHAHGIPRNSWMGSESPLGEPMYIRLRCAKQRRQPLNRRSQNNSLGVDIQEIQVTSNPELISRPDPLIRVRMVRIIFSVERRRRLEPNSNAVCGTGGFRDQRNGVDVAAQLMWWEVQPNDHVLQKRFANPSSLVFEGERVHRFLKPFPPTLHGRVRQ